jgi:Uncharacterized protein conserved in bacteria (DUF2255)
VRAYNGQNSRWYQAAMRQKAGRITAAGMTKEVAFEPVEGPINDLVDDAYRAKYRGSPYLSSIIGARARSRRSKSCRGKAMPDHDCKREKHHREMYSFGSRMAMTLSHAACGTDNTATEGTDSMKIRLKLQDRVPCGR